MILKRLYDEYDFAIERVLLKEYRRLDLTMSEMTVLIALFNIYKKRRSFSIAAISRRVEFSQNEIGTIVETLLNKGFITITLEEKDGKEREIFHMTPTFEKVEKLFINDEKEQIKIDAENQITQTISFFQQGLGRVLKPYELETIRNWYEEKLYTHEQIIKAIDQAGGQIGVKFVEKLLTQQELPKVAIDETVDETLDAIFKRLK